MLSLARIARASGGPCWSIGGRSLIAWPDPQVRPCANRPVARCKSTGAWSECAEVVKTRDYENYLCLALIKNTDLKRFALCLRAFNCEVANIKDSARTPHAAQIRFLYWKETVDKLFDKDAHPPDNEPIAIELKRCLEKVDYKLQPPWFKKLFESRLNNQGNFPFATLKEFLAYQEQSVSPVYYLLLEYADRLGCLGKIPNLAKVRTELDHIASHLGKSHGLLNSIRGMHRNALLEQCHVPDELLAKHGCTAEDIIRFSFEAQDSMWNHTSFTSQINDDRFRSIESLVHEIATLSKQNLRTAIRLYNELGLTMKQTNYIFLPFYVIDAYLDELEKSNFSYMEIAVFSRRHARLPLKLYWNSFEFNRLQ